MRPFKPPSFVHGPRYDSEPARVLDRASDAAIQSRSALNTSPDPLKTCITLGKRKREPLFTVPVAFINSDPQKDIHKQERQFYCSVMWRKPTSKKHKTWDGDGYLSVTGTQGILQNPEGKIIAKGMIKDIESRSCGDNLTIGGKECEIEELLPQEDFLKGKPFIASTVPIASYTHTKSTPRAQFKNPLKGDAPAGLIKSNTSVQPRHDPNAHNALVMRRPPSSHHDIVDVVVDPFIAQFLRQHQREGVTFLYDCLMRFKDYKGAGAVLADDMGLGKTLQSIALIWTLLKQNCHADQGPLAQKIIIVCPVTLTNNWKREFRKWLGQDRIGIFVVDTKSRIRDFLCGKVYQVMIIGYERLRMLHETEELKSANIDLVICDEGHRLKSANNKAAAAIKALKTTRRIILSGTPIQNDLSEFFVMIDFVNPGLLGTASTFKREFENPIIRARQPDATRTEKEKGAARSSELSRITDMFILRRTSDILSKFLPRKTELVLFCRPTKLQIEVQRRLLSSSTIERSIQEPNAALQLQAIMLLRKVCNSVGLLSKDTESSESLQGLSTLVNFKALVNGSPLQDHSGKLSLLSKLLLEIKSTTSEKVVIVSQFTQTLQVIQDCLNTQAMSYVRLDGSTPANKRQELVDKFNRSPQSTCFVFLLSAKSGGCGLNLIGGSRLILYDSDWNPSVDLQAMARIHRDGQKNPVFIYRLLTTGMIDEKIYQRQLTKQGLSDSLMDLKAAGSAFSTAELRDLFSFQADTDCSTHDLLCCPCEHDGSNMPLSQSEPDEDDGEEATWKRASQVSHAPPAARKCMQALHEYDHISPKTTSLKEALQDDVLHNTLTKDDSVVSYIFVKTSAMAES